MQSTVVRQQDIVDWMGGHCTHLSYQETYHAGNGEQRFARVCGRSR